MERVKMTLERIAEFACPEGKQQAFLWDTESPGLAVRATATGTKSFIFESKLNRRTIRMTLGDVRSWVLRSVWANGKENQRGAREEASRLKTLIDQGKDPRQVSADELAAPKQGNRNRPPPFLARRHKPAAIKSLWAKCGDDIQARRAKWSERHLFDHQKVINPERTAKAIQPAR